MYAKLASHSLAPTPARVDARDCGISFEKVTDFNLTEWGKLWCQPPITCRQCGQKKNFWSHKSSRHLYGCARSTHSPSKNKYEHSNHHPNVLLKPLCSQVMPIVDLLAISNTHFQKLKHFIHMQLPSGFPVKIEIPLFHVINAQITFSNIQVSTQTRTIQLL